MSTPDRNRVSRVWLLTLFGALALNLSAFPKLSHGTMSRDLASSSTGSDTCQNLVDQLPTAECDLKTNVQGQEIKSRATVVTKKVQQRDGQGHLTGGDDELEVHIDDVTSDCNCGDAGSRAGETFYVKLKDFRQLSAHIDESFNVRANDIAKHQQNQQECMEDVNHQALDTSAQLSCQLDRVMSFNDPQIQANYYSHTIRPTLMRQLASNDPNERAKAQVTLRNLDALSDANPYLSQSVKGLDKFSDHVDQAAPYIEQINQARTPADKQIWISRLQMLKTNWAQEYAQEGSDIQTKLDLPAGFTRTTYHNSLVAELSNPQKNGYMDQLNQLGTGAAPAAGQPNTPTTPGEGRTARGNVGEKPGAAPNHPVAPSGRKAPSIILSGTPGASPVTTGSATTPSPTSTGGIPQLGQKVTTLSTAPSH